MSDAFANVQVGEPLPASKRLWDKIIENARGKPPANPQQFDWKRWNPVTCKIRLKSGYSSVSQWQPCMMDVPSLSPTWPWQDAVAANGEAVMDVIPCTSLTYAQIMDRAHGLVVPVEPLSGTRIVTGIVDGVIPGGVQLQGFGPGDPGRPLTRRVVANNFSGGAPFTGWIGLRSTWGGTQEYASGEVIWYDPAVSSSTPVAALIRIPCDPQPVRVYREQNIFGTGNTYYTKVLSGTDWNDCGPPMPSSGSNPNYWVDSAPSPGGWLINRACSFTVRAWGTWTSRGIIGTGVAVATGAGVTSKNVHSVAETSVDLAIRYTPNSGTESHLGGYKLTNHTQSIVDATTANTTRCLPFYLEYTGYFGIVKAPFRLSLEAKPTAGSFHQIIHASTIDVWDDTLHNTYGAGGKNTGLPPA